MPWQVYALSGQLEYVGAESELGWRFIRRESLVSTARQQGKSVALQALIGWFLTQYCIEVGRPVQVLSVANQLDRAEAIYTNLSPRLIEQFGGKGLQAIGRKTLRMANGSVWDVRAATPRLHGGSYDLIVVDELWNVGADTVDEALRPSQIAKDNPLLSMWSTAGDQGSAAMISYRERALADIDNKQMTPNYFAEWSLPAGVSPRDESYWGYPNPALGITVSLDALRAASTKDGFIRAHLNQWVTARGAWLEPGLWEELVEPASLPAGGVLAVDSSLDESRYVGVRAALRDDRVIVDIAFAVDTEEQLWREVERHMGDKQITLAVTPGLATHLPTVYNRRFEQVGYAELIRYTALVRSMISERRVWHRGSEILTEHVTRAVSSKAQNGLVLSSQKSPGPIEAARCRVWAVGMASKAQNRQRPLVVVAS